MKARQRPRKSLRTILILWLLIFSIVPLAFITGYSLVRYEQAIDQEMSTRLVGNARQISTILSEFQSELVREGKQVAGDRAITYFVATGKFDAARENLKRWFKSSFGQRVWIFNRDGRLEIALSKDEKGDVQRNERFERAAIELQDPLLKSFEKNDNVFVLDFTSEAGGKNSQLELSVFTKILGPGGKSAGFIEEALTLDQAMLLNLRNRHNAEIFFFQPGGKAIVATHEDIALYKTDVFKPFLENDGFFEMNVRQVPFQMMLREQKWGDGKFVMGLGVSKSAAAQALANVKTAFIFVVGFIVLLLIVLSVIASRVLLRPIYQVLDALEQADFDKGLIELPLTNETELGLLAEGFNQLSRRTFDSQSALKGKIQELERASNEIRDTQAKLVHTAKMASLGQLVAGVAHELNNPIGFIYSNMTHLREYSQKLIHLVEVAENDPGKLKAEKKKADLDYIVTDLPKLITSCEDGARRTRDIVLGLRNFSRLEEAQLKKVDVHEGLENTLNLLTGELKNRIQVFKHFGKIPKVTCYPSQLNQVFMNVLGNAAQAIESEGEIHITTRALDAQTIEISIRDTGKGMNKATLEKVFDPFFTTKGLGSGTGLGLSISYGVIQKHGGDIAVTSEVGKGTEFRIILPIKPKE